MHACMHLWLGTSRTTARGHASEAHVRTLSSSSVLLP
uniref:Uncharacterized protein n=1 Tax=Arundo donax TaxID=35708 RepID=A0A0A9A3N9_ARUDO